VAADFFTTEVWTAHGLATYYTVLVIDLQSRRVYVASSMPYPDEAFVVQAMRDLTNAIDGLLAGGCVLIRDRDGKWSRAVLALLEQEEVRIIRTPFRAPNGNAYAERCAPRRRREEKRDVTQLPHCSFAAQEMRVGPSDSDCRVRVQTTGSGAGPMTGVVSMTEKAGRTRQVCPGKTNASEPLRTCRKRMDVTETRLHRLAWDEARTVPADGPGGDRHEGGVIPGQALVRNVGTCRLDAKGDLRVVDP
jgi:transposase InsO family protein